MGTSSRTPEDEACTSPLSSVTPLEQNTLKKKKWGGRAVESGGVSFREKKGNSFQVQKQSFSLPSVYQLGRRSQREYRPGLIGVIQLPIS